MQLCALGEEGPRTLVVGGDVEERAQRVVDALV
jgi:hypothetical protein